MILNKVKNKDFEFGGDSNSSFEMTEDTITIVIVGDCPCGQGQCVYFSDNTTSCGMSF